MAIDEATKEEGDLEVVAKDLDVFPQVFPLLAEEDIVENCPEKENKCLAIASCILPNRKIQGYLFLGLKSTNVGSYLSHSEEQCIRPRHWEFDVWMPEVCPGLLYLGHQTFN